MKVRPFFQCKEDKPTTLSEIHRVNEWVGSSEFFGVYAYATQSGVSAFEMQMGKSFWQTTKSRWLFSIDYGRTQPKALSFMLEQPNSEVRIYDGKNVLENDGFVPIRDFHAKTAFAYNPKKKRYGMICGSGNFSSNGLRASLEAGVSLQAKNSEEYKKTFCPTSDTANELWEASIPAADLIADYTAAWSSKYVPANAGGQIEVDINNLPDAFWIEAGYVTRNRGDDRPGNQIDFPRGMNRFFGFNAPDDQKKNTVIGEITFAPLVGDNVTNNLRMGNNMMEKISLPIPETHGFDQYDGKVLVFQRDGKKFKMLALEADDFEKAFGGKLAGIQIMGSGRRYGHIT